MYALSMRDDYKSGLDSNKTLFYTRGNNVTLRHGYGALYYKNTSLSSRTRVQRNMAVIILCPLETIPLLYTYQYLHLYLVKVNDVMCYFPFLCSPDQFGKLIRFLIYDLLFISNRAFIYSELLQIFHRRH